MLKPIPNPRTHPAPVAESEWLRQIAAKDRRAFESLYRAYYRRLSRFIGQITHRPHVTEEILNDTMLVVWSKAGTFDGTCKVSTWIFAIAYRKSLKAMKGHRDAVEMPPEHRDDAITHGPEEEAMRRDGVALIGRALACLPFEQRAVVEMTFFHGYAYQEIAQIVGCPLGTVKTRMFHARRKLHALLQADPPKEAPGRPAFPGSPSGGRTPQGGGLGGGR